MIPEDWEVHTLSEMCIKIQDGTHFSPSLGGTDYLYITSKNIGRGFLKLDNAERIDESEHKKIYSRCDVKKGDLLLTKDGVNTGNVALNTLDEEFSLLSSVALLRFDSNQYDANHFLQQILSSEGQNRMKDLMSGNAITRLTLEKIHKIPFPVPPLPEQRAIATALSDVDALIAALDKLIAKQRHLKTATMQQLLTGKKRLPGFGEGKGYKQTEVGVIPEDWDVQLLSSLANVQRGASPRPIDSPVWFDRNSLVGWVRISDVTRSGMYLYETEQKLSPLGIQHSRPVSKSSLIMSICATIGRPIITKIDVCIHDGFVVFDNLKTEQLFMYYILKWIEPSWSKQGQTGSQMNLNTELINSTFVSLPSASEQRAIATVLFDMDAEIVALEARRAKTQAIKQGMMQELLTGRTRLV